jgi:hypothetical protein
MALKQDRIGFTAEHLNEVIARVQQAIFEQLPEIFDPYKAGLDRVVLIREGDKYATRIGNPLAAAEMTVKAAKAWLREQGLPSVVEFLIREEPRAGLMELVICERRVIEHARVELERLSARKDPDLSGT